MFSNNTNRLALLLTLFTTLALPNTFIVAQSEQEKQVSELPTLEIKPTKCVSLKQDQICFTHVDITWQTRENNDYCLYSSQQKLPLQCWLSTPNESFSHEIKMSQDVTYSLTNKKTNQILVSEVLPLAWVYKKEKFSHSSWRIF